MLTFVIPVRHPDNSKNWRELTSNLLQTANAISNQKHPGWRAVVVANRAAELPVLPKGFHIERVDFPPNPFHERGNLSKEDFYNAVRIDKGRRLLAGMLQAAPYSKYFMVVDDDDFVSNGLAGFVAANDGQNGWRIENGYVWSSGGRLLYRHPRFHTLCGTSHIVRVDLFRLPARLQTADDVYIRRRLGSHIFIDDDLSAEGSPLAPLPFAGAIYRVGHSGSHSLSQSLVRKFVIDRLNWRKPLTAWEGISRLAPVTPSVRREFSLSR